MVDIYKLIDILYFISTLLFSMINFSYPNEKFDKKKDTKKHDHKDIKWVSLDNDSNDWGWVEEEI